MGFYFRRTAKLGPIRLNFSKSGIGASVGVKGVRLTRTARGTTYITVGSNGFYYRETISNTHTAESSQTPQNSTDATSLEGEIITARASELVDSSQAALIDRLNERAKMINPAWLFYLAGAFAIFVSILFFETSTNPLPMPSLPDVAVPLSVERKSNKIDEYSLLIARYGQPDKIVLAQSRFLTLRTAIYDSVHLGIIFVPNGCVDVYEFEEAHKQNPSNSSLKYHKLAQPKSLEKAPNCVPQENKGWTIVSYIDTTTGSSVYTDYAFQQLATIISKSSSVPTVVLKNNSTNAHSSLHRNSNVAAEDTSIISFDENTVKTEEQRLQQAEFVHEQNRTYAIIVLLAGVGLFATGGLAHRRNKLKRATQLIYELNETVQQDQAVLEDSLTNLAKSHVVWRVIAKSRTYDWKHNAGAGHLVQRNRAMVNSSTPPRVKSNISFKCIDLGSIKLYFLPDLLLCWEGGTFGAVAYDDLVLEQGTTRFIEDEQVPSDGRQIDQTWRYVRRDGGPDRRFNNNAQLPVMLYGTIALISSKGLNILLNTSNVEASATFAKLLLDFQKRRFVKAAPLSDESKEWASSSHLNALEILGLKLGASQDRIAEAYRNLAQMYHPDKVATLGIELRELAERRMKEINAAYQLLK
jgi:hypothetical protein